MESGTTDATGSGRTTHSEREVRLEFGHDSQAPRRARRLIEGLIPQGDAAADDLRLVTSELVTNVIQHTDGGGTLWAIDRRPQGPLHLEISDHDPSLPHRNGTAGARGGRGLHIVDHVCDRWGVRSIDGDGKTVWAEIDPGTRPSASTSGSNARC